MVKDEEIEHFFVTRSRLQDIYAGFCRFQKVMNKREKTFVDPISRIAAINASRYSDTSKMRSSEFDDSHYISNASSVGHDSRTPERVYEARVNAKILQHKAQIKKQQKPLLGSIESSS